MFEINLADIQTISPNTIKFIFEQAEKRLKATLDMSDRITSRSYALLAILIPSVSALFSIFNSPHPSFSIFQSIALVLSTISISICILLIVKVIFPRAMHQLGREPSIIALPEYYTNPDYPLEESYLLIMSNEIEDYQIRIDYMEAQNNNRLKLLKFAYYSMLFLYLLILIYFTSKGFS